MKQMIPTETYRLTLEHYICHGGECHRLDEPLVVQMVIDGHVPSPVYINRMLDMMRNEVLQMSGI